MNFWLFLSYFSGLHLFNPNMDPDTLLRTVLVVHTCDAVMCRLFAYNNGYPRNLWTVLGFIFGIWAVAIAIVLPNRNPPPERPEQG